MTRQLSIITPVAAAHGGLLVDAWRSIRDQRMPAGWVLRWYVQEDGPASAVREFVGSLGAEAADYAASGSPGGAAEARNLALARTTGEFVMLLDADDRLTAGAATRVIATLSATFGWCGFAALDERDGTVTHRDGGYSLRLGTQRDVPPESSRFDQGQWVGEVERGAVRECWERFAVLPFHPATFAADARLIWKVGGWPALSRDEDTALILAVSDEHRGVVSAEPNIVYRRHDHQTSRIVPPSDERLTFIRRRIRTT